MIHTGIDPSAQRRAKRDASSATNANSFEVVAREWLSNNHDIWVSGHSRTIQQRLERDIFPFIGSNPIAELTAADLLAVLRRIEDRQAYETAHRARTNLSQVFRYAIATGRTTSDPTRDLRGALRPVKTQHLPAITDPKHVGDLLRAFDAYRGGPIVSAALRFAPLVFVRPGELRQAEWSCIDLEQGEWRFIVSKTSTPHIVPLSRQAIEILKEVHLRTGKSRYVFPSPRSFDRPMSNNAILAALRSLGIEKEEMCGHGFRAMARTILDEVLGFPPHLIEHQLAHAVKDSLGRAYNRTKHLPERKQMMQTWADYLENLKRT